jgi:hypothetical protein
MIGNVKRKIFVRIIHKCYQGANLSMRSGAIAPGNQPTAPDKHNKLMWSGAKDGASLLC